MSDTTEQTAPATGNPPGPDDPGQGGQDTAVKTPDPAGEGEKGEQGKTFTQAQVDQMISDRLDRERKKITAQQTKDQEAAEEARLAESRQFEDLAKKRQDKLDAVQTDLTQTQTDLTQTQAELEAANTALQLYVDQLQDGVPPEVLSLLEGKTVADRLAWLVENGAKFKPQENGSPPTLPSTPPGESAQLTPEQRREKSYQVSF